jgi:hypothetical protein
MSKFQLTDLNNSSHLTELDCDQLDSITGGKGKKKGPSPFDKIVDGAAALLKIIF